MIEMGKTRYEKGYATDIITDKSLDWLDKRDKSKPFFLMCHHKAPHRSWESDAKHKDLYREDVKVPKKPLMTTTRTGHRQRPKLRSV
jgi:hypothetical protein